MIVGFSFVILMIGSTNAFCPHPIIRTQHALHSSTNSNNEDDAADSSGANLMAEFSKLAQSKGVELSKYDLEDLDFDDEDDEDDVVDTNNDSDDDDDDDDGAEPNIPQGAINAFLGYDTGDVGEKLAGNVELTDKQLYSEVKERVLDTAGGFVDFVGGANEDDDDEDGDGADGPKPYQAPETVPDSDLTAGEVCSIVLEALRNNDVPSPNRGVEILFGYSSHSSYVKQEEPNGLTPKEYADYLRETEYKVLFTHDGITIDKGKYSHDGKKAFFNASLRTGLGAKDWTSVNFILSTQGSDDNACWMIDSLLIRPQSMQRRRRR
eukprot:CAMPEP_0119567104 /NCGR_PEP_ID=MMETSP1352-20130426/34978_1 /TAXON_ID=265584 /ORGANISM="Stauroneis constricta, Strain CCMP1120" /LENGTH=321 /DNA_ID=CAMNT_0007616309 /DNA_START=51 /DNA_END=1016 /DNA_ORIENTATION=-